MLDCLRHVFLFLLIIYVQAGVEILKTRDFKWLVFLLFVTTGMQGATPKTMIMRGPVVSIYNNVGELMLLFFLVFEAPLKSFFLHCLQ